MIRETAGLALRGRWRDRYFRSGVLVHDTGWFPNQIQNVAPEIVAALLIRAGEHAPHDAPVPFAGISYMAVGAGDVAWDAVAPVQDRADATLHAEFFRKAIPAADMVFVDPGDPDVVVVGPTRMVQISVTLEQGEANDSLREFALFAGHAEAALDSGHILNWVVHPRIDKDNTMAIQRRVQIELLLPA